MKLGQYKEKQGGVQLEPHQVIVRPLVTERGVQLSEQFSAYSFEVHPQATKFDIRQAVESLFGVRVVRVRTQNRKGKVRRFKADLGVTRSWKKAVVELHEDDRIALF